MRSHKTNTFQSFNLLDFLKQLGKADWVFQILTVGIDILSKDRFDRLLKLVQQKASEASARFTGSVQKVLVEDVNEHDETMVTGRMSNNLLVHFKETPDLIGQIVDVLLE